MQVVSINSGKLPNDTISVLEDLIADLKAGRVSGLILAYVKDDCYSFSHHSSLGDSLILSTLLQQNCIDRMRA